ncbi:hypothetical protein Bca4012_058732 [Brassica carinata]|uniref:Uncharacterized protein n=1 Tax=Brassica carinata TaxID=52824 RepID=A0A8X7W528_BRACI|nr:hypothetical protein Bca52824_016435 [Brassica carinata]
MLRKTTRILKSVMRDHSGQKEKMATTTLFLYMISVHMVLFRMNIHRAQRTSIKEMVTTKGQRTFRNKEVIRSLNYWPVDKEPKATKDEQMIDALNDMELVDQYAGGIMDCEVHDDDLLGEELMEYEERDWPVSIGTTRTAMIKNEGPEPRRVLDECVSLWVCKPRNLGSSVGDIRAREQ